MRLDASSFRLVRGGASPTSFAGSLQTPQRHAAGAREWRFAHLELDAKVSIVTAARQGHIKKTRRRPRARRGVVVFKADGKRSAIRELRLPPGIRATVARGAPPAPPPAPAEAPPEAPPSPEEPKKRWFERARKVSIAERRRCRPESQPARRISLLVSYMPLAGLYFWRGTLAATGHSAVLG